MSKRILDPIYGEIVLPSDAWEVSKAPEVQRLREVRMCNINSLSLTGAGGAHRFEHSLGTAYLATRAAHHGLSSRATLGEERLLTLAGLLHDVGSAGFGHSVEYVLDSDGFRHDDLLAFASHHPEPLGYQYKVTDFEPVFFGLQRTLAHVLERSDIEQISQLVQGAGKLGPLISGSVDLDNIDNVYRLAYHMGLWRGGSAPLELADSLYTDDDGLVIDDASADLLDDWRAVRGELYRWLLLDEDEFAAKAMLESALASAREISSRSFRWHDVDYSLMQKLGNSTPDAAELANRLMTGRLFGCLGLFETLDGTVDRPSDVEREALQTMLEERLRNSGSRRLRQLKVAVHFIQDSNKTERAVTARTSSGRIVQYGSGIRRTLIGVFTSNTPFGADTQALSVLRENDIGELVRRELEDVLHIRAREVSLEAGTTSQRTNQLV